MASELEYHIAGVELESPLVNAAGSINGISEESILRDVSLLAATGIGAITVGSFTIHEQEGHAARYGEPVYHHDGKATYNSMGLPNIGMSRAIELAPSIIDAAGDKPVIFSISPSVERDSSAVQATQLAYEFLTQTDAKLVELNVGCPNIVTEKGSRKPVMGYDSESMVELLGLLGTALGKTDNLGLKLPPYITAEEQATAAEVATMLKESDVFSFLVTANTIPGQIPLNEKSRPILKAPEGKGGMSGPVTRHLGRVQLMMWIELMDNSIDIVSTLGVDSGEELAERMDLGAVAAGGVTMFWESNSWQDAVSRALYDFSELTPLIRS